MLVVERHCESDERLQMRTNCISPKIKTDCIHDMTFIKTGIAGDMMSLAMLFLCHCSKTDVQ